ncbi:hypothetical protein SAMN06265365_104187 [Tistlia consotensis]|uniref:DUF6898 domain-containing protein n=1 Tax=Tistlia consotensis USBA 355 TaxID=560819 RepID=A0A1Y6BP93_9PROT|nr:hypothetical protein [Tistlia consotensis]SMF21534.1 hypothetical protein SAMN05428998_107107 [Tistlia consotensis USBA 355]SNR46833.1 hypothetical protein SAMN06265365_104187 [Tistlia consotensis]
MDKRSVIVEFHSVGSYVKVSAIDSESLVEVSIVGDPAAGEAALQRAAVRKLEYVLQQRKPAAPAARPRGGLVV